MEGQDVVAINDQGFHFRLSQYLGGSDGMLSSSTKWALEAAEGGYQLLAAGFPATADAQLGPMANGIAALSHPHLLAFFTPTLPDGKPPRCSLR